MNSSNPFPAPMGIDGLQTISGTCSDTDYVHVVWGNLGRGATVVNIPTNGIPLAFQLFYNSIVAVPTVGPVGHWQHNWQMNLNFATSGVIVATMESGRPYNYIYDAISGNYLLDGSTSYFIPATITNPSSGVWHLNIYPDGGYYVPRACLFEIVAHDI